MTTTITSFPTQPGPHGHRRRGVVLLHAPHGGPGPRERRATFEATPDWDWSCSVVHDGRIDPVSDACLLARLRTADLVLCADDDLRAAVVEQGIAAAALTGAWPAPERWAGLLDDLHVVASC